MSESAGEQVSWFPATDMLDPDWMRRRVEDTARRWGSDDARVNGTLWWYSASSTLVAERLAAVLAGRPIPDPDMSPAQCFLRENGYLGGMLTTRTTTPAELGARLTAALTPLIDVLAEVSGASPRALWAITTDSVANRSFDGSPGDRDRASEVAEKVVADMRAAGAAAPMPRFVDIHDRWGRIRYTRRSSCCLIYETPGSGKCVSCPRQSPEIRREKLSSLRA
ncbi:hypothetical protein G4H71_17215 [Rhodococcus triatomae]|uniref:FhuF 2Fe-2S C-terminal domain-containing protein n=1 Tax=Rhodococcus triatomae TaxID=300028 RepID=A0A1G8FP18_9NOCA|nr:(2Fe-2S)-binding protein [Rhodococcus triatomae]QNG19535.1 hypothetical protein G4H72_13160 [Rhodococcus triatomae]QNG24550.1 hypothetical protein G4H71_17215 [Rhodococcus triatomae]SDH83865.1 FhuF 2Fe-2S C-terminal domain-containing protein [Rhodococcus triatomae]